MASRSDQAASKKEGGGAASSTRGTKSAKAAPEAAPKAESKSKAAPKAAAKPESNYEFDKPWGGTQNFMHSYGLKMWNNDDVQEAKAIRDAFREHDASESRRK